MSRTPLHDREVNVITVTPVSRGVTRPVLLTLTTLAIVVDAALRYSFVHRHEPWFLLVFVAPLAVLSLCRIWGWRSHQIHVTNQRVIMEGGVFSHWRTSVDLADVRAVLVDQRLHERLSRRGYVYVETDVETVPVGQVRHPGALARLIDAERLEPTAAEDAFDGWEPETAWIDETESAWFDEPARPTYAPTRAATPARRTEPEEAWPRLRFR